MHISDQLISYQVFIEFLWSQFSDHTKYLAIKPLLFDLSKGQNLDKVGLYREKLTWNRALQWGIWQSSIIASTQGLQLQFHKSPPYNCTLWITLIGLLTVFHQANGKLSLYNWGTYSCYISMPMHIMKMSRVTTQK